uniref:VWA N-terminal domain-containing protein n=1 Tax=Astyanax mexicanus TaxID=7994 RepID=A0A3B1K703_ASTMX
MDALKLPAAALLLLLLSLNSPVSSNQFPDSKQAREWANHIEEDLLQLINAEVDIEHLTKVFNDLEDKYKVEHNNAQQLVANAASNIDKLLANRSKALEALATAAEKLQVEHQWRDDFEEDYNQYYNAKDDTYLNNTLDFIKDPAFKRLVSYNSTAVHIPTDIYEGSTIVLNELNWTQALDEVFKKNKEEDPTLLWQVFGSATGLARYFPASPWIETKKTAGKIDLYDVRRRPWYIQGAASPKDMLILVDASGSVSGLTLKLIRTSVSEMLETLSDDDYVNVVFVSKTRDHSFPSLFLCLIQSVTHFFSFSLFSLLPLSLCLPLQLSLPLSCSPFFLLLLFSSFFSSTLFSSSFTHFSSFYLYLALFFSLALLPLFSSFLLFCFLSFFSCSPFFSCHFPPSLFFHFLLLLFSSPSLFFFFIFSSFQLSCSSFSLIFSSLLFSSLSHTFLLVPLSPFPFLTLYFPLSSFPFTCF